MGRIIPWDLPKVNGGSVGGYTPDPTPDPGMVEPYDLTDASFAVSATAISSATKVKLHTGAMEIGDITAAVGILGLSVNVDGVKFVDTTKASQTVAHIHIPKDDVKITAPSGADTNPPKYDLDFDIDITAGMVTRPATVSLTSVQGAVIPFCNNRTKYTGSGIWYVYVSSIEITAVDVYGPNGAIIQSWTPEAEE